MKRSNRKRNGNGNSFQLLSIPRPPSNQANIEVSNKMIRYNEVTTSTTVIDRKDLLNLVVLPDTTTTAYGLLKSIKINRIRIWGVVSTATNPIGTGGDNVVTWSSTLGKEVTVRSTQMGIAPSYLDTRPPVNSLAGFWTSASSTLTENLVSIDAENGSIIDIEYAIIFANDNASRNFAITTGVVGKVSYNNFGSWTVQGYQNYTPA